jgi:hypothetical protein
MLDNEVSIQNLPYICVERDILWDRMLVGEVTRYKAVIVVARSNNKVMGSNAVGGFYMCPLSVFALSCVSSGLVTGCSCFLGIVPI